jgi:hypothetical protein
VIAKNFPSEIGTIEPSTHSSAGRVSIPSGSPLTQHAASP